MEMRKKYSTLSIIIMFIVISHGAWIWEGLLTMTVVGEFVNRGFLHGFWLPLYGTGSILLLYVFGKEKNSFWKIFLGSAAICTTMEYAVAIVLEKLFHKKWWDYGDVFLNLKGRICLPVVFAFGFAGYLLIRLLAPYMDRQIQKISLSGQKKICIFFGIMMLLDFGISLFYPNTGRGIAF
ncbi:MAG: putative ABC transporter permease [Clostridium sp.]|nr:putative ABC transporter permease [Clostridium sp.]